MSKLGSNQKVEIFYNQVDISKKVYKVLANCPSVKVPWRQAVEYADKKISDKEWTEYLIPELTGAKVIFEEESITEGEIMRKIICTCGNEEEMDIDIPRDHSREFIHSMNDGEGEAFYICTQCHNEVKSITE
tara:strand:- start:1668 stop:2063 length:396 start_codon:yes stop_codon:yes gene_type:complete